MTANRNIRNTLETVEWQSSGAMDGSDHGSFVECQDGLTHLVSFNEYTLCGDALEGDHEIPASRPTKRRTITCPRCAEIITMCRGVKCKPNID